MLIWVCTVILVLQKRSTQHWETTQGAHLSENKGVMSECKKTGKNSRQRALVSTICDEYCRIYPGYQRFFSRVRQGASSAAGRQARITLSGRSILG